MIWTFKHLLTASHMCNFKLLIYQYEIENFDESDKNYHSLPVGISTATKMYLIRVYTLSKAINALDYYLYLLNPMSNWCVGFLKSACFSCHVVPMTAFPIKFKTALGFGIFTYPRVKIILVFLHPSDFLNIRNALIFQVHRLTVMVPHLLHELSVRVIHLTSYSMSKSVIAIQFDLNVKFICFMNICNWFCFFQI